MLSGRLAHELYVSLCVDSYAFFHEQAWPHAEPTRALLPSVATDGIAAALQSVSERRIQRLVIACPPGVSKSLSGAVTWPAWLLLRSGGTARVMAGSYSWDFASRDSRRCRDLMQSAWYRDLVANAWQISVDRESDVWTSRGGRRLIVSVGGKALGERCTFQLVDDALSGADVHSAPAKKEAARWISEVLPSRLEDPDRDPRVVVGQRLCADDPIAGCLERGWRYLRLPATLEEGEEPCELRDDAGELVWRDPRKPNEPLLALLNLDALAKIKAEIGSVAFNAQYQQRVVDESTSMFKRSCLTRRWTTLPDGGREAIALDASFKEGSSSDYAVIQCWRAIGGDRFLVEQWRRQAGFSETLAALKAMAERHPFARVEIELAANGHAILDAIRREVPSCLGVKPIGSKIARAASVQAIVESGALVLPANAPWLEEWLDEVCAFTADGAGTPHDDQVDAMTYCLRALARLAHTSNVADSLPMGGSVHDVQHSSGDNSGADINYGGEIHTYHDSLSVDLRPFEGWKP